MKVFFFFKFYESEKQGSPSGFHFHMGCCQSWRFVFGASDFYKLPSYESWKIGSHFMVRQTADQTILVGFRRMAVLSLLSALCGEVLSAAMI